MRGPVWNFVQHLLEMTIAMFVACRRRNLRSGRRWPQSRQASAKVATAKSGAPSGRTRYAKAKAMPDFGDDEWPGMICVETANVGDGAVRLEAGRSHQMRVRIRVE